MVVPPVVTSNAGATFFYQTRLSFEFDFGLTGSSLLACSSPLFSVSHSIINSRSWRHLVCIIIAGWNFHLYNLEDRFPHTLLKVCSAHRDKVEIKCMCSVGGKTPTKPKLIYTSLTLGTLNHDKIDVMCIVHSFNIGDKI